jgi:hypothetical protein
MPPGPIANIETFISYARQDSEFALKLVHDLRTAGVRVWFDRTDIPVGKDWTQAVEAALASCERFLVILSPASVTSKNVLAELNFALDEGKRVFPVLYRDCKRPFRIRSAQYADFTTDYDIGLSDLARTFGPGKFRQSEGTESEQLNLNAVAGTVEKASKGRPRRWIWYAAVIALLTALGVFLADRAIRGHEISGQKTQQGRTSSPQNSPRQVPRSPAAQKSGSGSCRIVSANGGV